MGKYWNAFRQSMGFEGEPREEGFALVTLVAVMMAWTVLRFTWLASSPPGFYIDESAQATHFLCLAERGTDANGVRHPFFSSHFEPRNQGAAGLLPPTLLYSGALWARIFGPSIASIRAMSAFFMSLAIAGVYFLGGALGGPVAGFLGLASAAISPWLLSFSRMAGPQAIELCGLVWGCFFVLRSSRRRDAVIGGALLSAAMYSYPPARVQVALLLVPLSWLRARALGSRLAQLIPFLAAFAAASVPVLIQSFSPENLARVTSVGIFNKGNAATILATFCTNFLAHFRPSFLFTTGDWNMRHSSRHFGELSWLDMAALAGGAWIAIETLWRRKPLLAKKAENVRYRQALAFAVMGYLSGLVPSALTQGPIPGVIPHALRAVGAAPFLALLAGLVLSRVLARRPGLWPATALLALSFSFLFWPTYLLVYPGESQGPVDDWWTPTQRFVAERAARTGDWTAFGALVTRIPEVSNRYYLMAYGGETCASSQERLELLMKSMTHEARNLAPDVKKPEGARR